VGDLVRGVAQVLQLPTAEAAQHLGTLEIARRLGMTRKLVESCIDSVLANDNGREQRDVIAAQAAPRQLEEFPEQGQLNLPPRRRQAVKSPPTSTQPLREAAIQPDAPEMLFAAEQPADIPLERTSGIRIRPIEAPAPSTGVGGTATSQTALSRLRGRPARNLLRFTAPRSPESTESDPAASDASPPLADFDRLTASIESVTEALGGQPLEFYERDLPQIAAAETARRVRADVVVLLLDNGEGIMEVSGGVGLTPAERHLSVEYSRDVMRELFRAGVGLIEDTDRVRGALAGIPGSRAETLVMVPLVHERLGFGVLMAGRNRSQTAVPTEVFSDTEIEVLMGFADAAAASLRIAVLLRHLKGQLRVLEDDP
jgi:hypothetical protein